MAEKRLIKRLASTESTNTVAMEMARQGAPAGTVVVAETQTAGRGRLARTWLSPPGAGLYFSVILRPSLLAADLPKITLAAGVAACQAIESQCAIAPRIKWPNDLLLGGRKFGGILTESEPQAGSDPQGGYLVILGIGLNVTTPTDFFTGDLAKQATSLLEFSGRSFSRETLLWAILERIDSIIQQVESIGFQDVLFEWRKRDAMLGESLAWMTAGGLVVSGEALGLDDSGAYHIRDAAGTVHEVLSGDLNLHHL